MTSAGPAVAWRRIGLGAVSAAGVAVPAHRAGTLSGSGAVAALAVGTAIFGGGTPRDTAALLTFFVTSSALSRLPGRTRPAIGESRRNHRQVLANGGVAALLASLGGPRGGRVRLALAGALAAATADTWATEIGMRWGGRPRSIASGVPLTPGASGGVTLLGTLAGAAGAALVGMVAVEFGQATVAATLAGIVGMLTDSLLGATVQVRYWCPRCGVESERVIDARGHRLVRSRGLPGFDNDVVNLLATGAGAAAGGVLSRPLGRRGTID